MEKKQKFLNMFKGECEKFTFNFYIKKHHSGTQSMHSFYTSSLLKENLKRINIKKSPKNHKLPESWGYEADFIFIFPTKNTQIWKRLQWQLTNNKTWAKHELIKKVTKL